MSEPMTLVQVVDALDVTLVQVVDALDVTLPQLRFFARGIEGMELRGHYDALGAVFALLRLADDLEAVRDGAQATLSERAIAMAAQP